MQMAALDGAGDHAASRNVQLEMAFLWEGDLSLMVGERTNRLFVRVRDCRDKCGGDSYTPYRIRRL